MKYLLRTQGFREGRKIATFITAWAVAEKAEGRELRVDEYSKWWKEALSTSYRDLERFRRAFPNTATPHVLIERCRSLRKEPSMLGLSQVPMIA